MLIFYNATISTKDGAVFLVPYNCSYAMVSNNKYDQFKKNLI